MDSIHFKTDFNMKKKILFLLNSFIPLLFTVSKLYYTYYHLMLLMMVCIVLIWFLLTVLQESSNLDAIFIVCRKIKKIKLASWFLCQPPPPSPFLVKSQLFDFFNPSLRGSIWLPRFFLNIIFKKFTNKYLDFLKEWGKWTKNRYRIMKYIQFKIIILYTFLVHAPLFVLSCNEVVIISIILHTCGQICCTIHTNPFCCGECLTGPNWNCQMLIGLFLYWHPQCAMPNWSLVKENWTHCLICLFI